MPVFPNGWFSWGTTLAVVVGDAAFSVQPQRGGWRRVNAADVTWDGRPISEAEARRVFADDFESFGDPPVSNHYANDLQAYGDRR